VEYSADGILVRSTLEAIRHRPVMYVGALEDAENLTCLVTQGMCLALDELLVGTATRMIVALEAEGGVSITDNGHGLPAEIIEKLFTVIAGCRLARVSTAAAERYCTVGLAVLNALSASSEARSTWQGASYRQSFVKGEQVGPPETLAAAPPGTTLRFRLDPEFFSRPIDAASLARRLDAIRAEVPGEILLVDERV
jgi:DNA gyrase subunit B